MSNPNQRLQMLESIAKGLNSELMSITKKIASIEAQLDEWDRSRKNHKEIDNEMPRMRNQ